MAEVLPGIVLDRVRAVVGDPVTVASLGGMSGARVVRVSGPAGSIVAKAGVSPRELAVYRSLSRVLAAAGVRIPILHGAVDVEGEAWLLLEDIPAPLPRDRWLADSGLLAMLNRLHHLPPPALDALPDRFRPEWPEAMTDAALGWLHADTSLARRLASLRREAAPLFVPRCVISGDPNPLNWGLSDLGELVLMDWERIGLGHPAIDLAITVPGLPTTAEFDRTVEVYRRVGELPPVDVVPVDSRLLMLAKVWTIIELLAGTPTSDRDASEPEAVRRRQSTAVALALAEVVPDWIRRVTRTADGDWP